MPTVRGDAVLIQVRACAVGRLDIQVREGMYEDILELREKVSRANCQIDGIPVPRYTVRLFSPHN